MSASEPFNFGRKIKELKRINKKGYADLTAGLKISRERIIQLEENEREPNEAERRRFAAFYSLPPEEFGLVEGGAPASPPAAPPIPRPAPPPGQGFGGGGNFGPPPAERRFDNPPPFQGGERQGGFQERPGGYERQGGERPGGFQGGERQGGYERPGGFQGGERQGGFQGDRRPSYGGGAGGGQRPGGFGNSGGRSGPGGPGGGRSGPGGPGGGNRPGSNGMRQDQPPRSEPKEPREPREPKSNENKPVMKYTAEQLGDIESAYLRKQRDLKVALTFTFLNGKEYTGVVTDFTPFTVHITDSETGQEVILRKLAMAYYRKADAAATPPRPGAANGEKPVGGED